MLGRSDGTCSGERVERRQRLDVAHLVVPITVTSTVANGSHMAWFGRPAAGGGAGSRLAPGPTVPVPGRLPSELRPVAGLARSGCRRSRLPPRQSGGTSARMCALCAPKGLKTGENVRTPVRLLGAEERGRANGPSQTKTPPGIEEVIAMETVALLALIMWAYSVGLTVGRR